MANPQAENGYIRISSEVMEALCRTRIPGEPRQILDVIIRKTWGYHKKWDRITLSQFNALTNIPKDRIIKGLHRLKAMRLIVQKDNGKLATYCFQKDYSLWKTLSKKTISGKSCSKRQFFVVQKDNHTKDNNTKDILCRDSEKSGTLFPVFETKQSTPKKTNPDVKLFIDEWCENYISCLNRKYAPDNKDAALIKRMLSTWTIDELRNMAAVFLNSKDDWILKAGKTIGIFYQQRNKL